MSYNISDGDTFYGYIPDGSDELHLGIVLGVKDIFLKYCYCTSKYKKLFNETDFVKIAKEYMKPYFPNPIDTYIFLSPRHIFNILIITFTSRLNNSEYDQKEPIDKNIFIAILNKIRNSNNLSERFKQDFFDFLDKE
jgi:hypothetical protein